MEDKLKDPTRKVKKKIAGKSSDQNLNIPLLKFHFRPERVRAVRAQVFIFIPVRQNQQKPFANGNRLPAAGTK